MQGVNGQIIRLLELMKSEQGRTALRLVTERLAKGKNDLTPTYGLTEEEKADEQKEMENLAEERWGRDKPPAAEDHLHEMASAAAIGSSQEPDVHFLERKKPHPHSRKLPWEMYHLGMGNESGKVVRYGAPMTADDVLNTIQSAEYDPHRLLIRPSDKSSGWTQVKSHPNFKDFTGRHLADLYDKNLRGKIPAAEFQRYHNKSINAMNPTEVAMASRRKK